MVVRPALMLAALTGEALKWAKKEQLSTKTITYMVLRGMLLSEFEPKARESSELTARFQIHQMKLTKVSEAQAILAKFDSLVKDCPSITETEVVHALYCALPKVIQDSMTKLPKTLAEGIRHVLRWIDTKKISRPNLENLSSGGGGSNPMDIGGVEASRLTELLENQRKSIIADIAAIHGSKIRCWGCGKVGHIQRNCLTHPPSKEDRPDRRGPSYNKGRSFYELGCVDDTNAPVIVDVLVGGIKARMMADTGAAVTTISHRLLNLLNARRMEPAVVQVGGNAKVVTSKLEKLSIRSVDHGITVSLQPIVLDLGKYDGLLGRDWLGRASLMPDVCSGRLLRVPLGRRRTRIWRVTRPRNAQPWDRSQWILG